MDNWVFESGLFIDRRWMDGVFFYFNFLILVQDFILNLNL